MRAIVCVDKKWGIGKDGGLLFKLPLDMARFKKLTTGGIVIMGYNTFLSLPKQKPLPNRRNIILYEGDLTVEGAEVVHSKEELFKLIPYDTLKDAWLIGGATVYKNFLDECQYAYVTKVRANGKADVFFPNLDAKDSPMRPYFRRPVTVDNGYITQFIVYKNKILIDEEQHSLATGQCP